MLRDAIATEKPAKTTIEIAVFCDLDGTLTGSSGAKTENSNFYQSLFVVQDRRRVLKPKEEVQALFVEKFGEYTDEFNYKSTKETDILLSRQSLTFLKELLKHEQVAFHIITRNCRHYATALLTYHGLTSEELAKLTIKESVDKNKDVKKIIKEMRPITGQILAYVFDDNKSEMTGMRNAIYGSKGKHFKIESYSKQPGQFKWSNYLKTIKEQLNAPKQPANGTEEVTASAADNPSSFFFSPDASRKTDPAVQETKRPRLGVTKN